MVPATARLTLGGETVLQRHEKTLVSRTRYAVSLCNCMDEAAIEAKLAAIPTVDYERIGERMYAELIYINYSAEGSYDYVELVKKAAGLNRVLILGCEDPEVAKAALAVCKEGKPILNGATAANCEAMNEVAKEAGVALGVKGADIDDLYDTVVKLEGMGNKNLLIDCGTKSIKEAYAIAVQFRRAAIKDGNRSCGYPSIVNAAVLAKGDMHLQAALASMFTINYGSIIVLEEMSYAVALPSVWSASECIYRPAEADEGNTGHLPHQRRRREFYLSDHRRLRPDLFRSIRRAGAFRRSLQPDHL